MFDIYLRKILELLGRSGEAVDADVLQCAVQCYRVRLDAVAAARQIQAKKSARGAGGTGVAGV